MHASDSLGAIGAFLALGGPVLAIILLLSVLALTVFLVKLFQFRQLRVGRHTQLRNAIRQWDAGQRDEARQTLARSGNYLARVAAMAIAVDGREGARARLESEAEQRLRMLERGLRFLDFVAQLAPLLGLFGTVLGMIEAFQAMQGAGAQVDPSVLAGGIWVALLTTAAGLALAMPVSAAVAWLESRIDGERALADLAISTVATPLPEAAGDGAA
ncbi:MotA/TolQ/ExbB proton channel family protein [Stakelama tenebrarum]|uniref:MotA/TolQ/ExbB proton channel family protein n=1 Tax=Stakelama tenebrarum TaxID=2711215 RepID=A0A6G6Y2B9_9SPHN|nr:MotA/TolQ/ExbB proton channel family protein [Sphingosinithalassobacter tenebrarum]QIG78753.1 MotA/TolQ/ExbB proton channel family protein [Sphingosinithalassobacter tenebrarum]